MMHIRPIDWTILATGFCFYACWALYLNSKSRSAADYLVSGRRVRMWLGMGAGIAGEIGLIDIAAMCEQGYSNGYSFVFLNMLSLILVIPLFGFFGFGIERFRATRCVSVPQYIEMRYSRNLRIVVGIVNCLAGVLQMSIFPIGGAIYLRQFLAMPELLHLSGLTIRSDVAIMSVLLLCPLLFTILGGYTTLIVTNFFQGVCVIAVMMVLLVYVVSRAVDPAHFTAGLQQTWTGLEANLKEAGVNPFAENPGAYGFQWFIFMNMMTILMQFSYGPYLQQYAAMDRPKTVSRSYLLAGIFGFGRSLIIFGLGVATVAAIGTSPPTGLAISPAEWTNFATPSYLSHLGIPAGLLGFVLLTFLFADVSVTDKYMLSWSTSIVNDCINPLRKKDFHPREQIRAVRLTVVVLCVWFFLFGLLYKPGMAIWSFMWLTSNLIGGSGIAVLLGMYWPRARTAGAYACIAICVVVPLVDVASRQLIAHLGGRPLPWTPEQTGLYTYLAGTLAMIVVSMISREPSKFIDYSTDVRILNSSTRR
jgi:SSS family solute:Na+ symporter